MRLAEYEEDVVSGVTAKTCVPSNRRTLCNGQFGAKRRRDHDLQCGTSLGDHSVFEESINPHTVHQSLIRLAMNRELLQDPPAAFHF